jgi:hypothetical protein
LGSQHSLYDVRSRLGSYGKKGLLDLPGSIQSFQCAPSYKNGFCVPHNTSEVPIIDTEKGNTQWVSALQLEMDSMMEYMVFKDIGYGPALSVNKKTQVHFVFNVKHDRRHKAHLVAGGHSTEAPVESIYSGVVSLQSIQHLHSLPS